MSFMKTKAEEIANAWGPALTKAMNDGDCTAIKSICIEKEPVYLVLQGPDGNEIETSIGDVATEADMSWETFQKLISKDVQQQEFLKLEAVCLGVLGDRMMIETGRFNKSGEVYLEAYSLLTITQDTGKVSMFEAFVDTQLSGFMKEAEASSSSSSSKSK